MRLLEHRHHQMFTLLSCSLRRDLPIDLSLVWLIDCLLKLNRILFTLLEIEAAHHVSYTKSDSLYAADYHLSPRSAGVDLIRCNVGMLHNAYTRRFFISSESWTSELISAMLLTPSWWFLFGYCYCYASQLENPLLNRMRFALTDLC